MATQSDHSDAQAQRNQVANLSVYKRDKDIIKFMNKYRYQYHVTMLPDLAMLVRNAYLEGYHNGLGQYPVSDLPTNSPDDSTNVMKEAH